MSERERFEAWWRDFWIVKASTNALELAFTKLAWDAWQAALADRPEQTKRVSLGWARLDSAGDICELNSDEQTGMVEIFRDARCTCTPADDEHGIGCEMGGMTAVERAKVQACLEKLLPSDRPEQPVALLNDESFIDEQRAVFEAWALDHGLNISYPWMGSPAYRNVSTNHAWAAWQAALAANPQQSNERGNGN